MRANGKKPPAYQGINMFMLRGGASSVARDQVLEVTEQSLVLALREVVNQVQSQLDRIMFSLDTACFQFDPFEGPKQKPNIDPVSLLGTWQFLHGIAQAFNCKEPAAIAREIQDDLDNLANLKVAGQTEKN